MISHSRVELLLAEAIDFDLAVASAREVAEHLASCPACAAYAAALRTDAERVSQMPRHHAPPRVRAALEQAARRPARRAGGRVQLLLAAALLLGLLLGAALLVGSRLQRPDDLLPAWAWSRHEGTVAMPFVMGAGSGVVVGFRGDESGLEAVRSTDGITWTAVAAIDPLDKARVAAIAAKAGGGSDAFVAVGSSTEASEIGRAAAWVSDGAGGWNRAPDGPDLGNASGSGGSDMTAVAWGQGKWVAGGAEWNESVGQDGVTWTSPDGLNWSRATLPDAGLGIMGLVAGGPGFVAVGSSESVEGDMMPGAHVGIWTSVDGTIWTRVPDGPIFANSTISAVVSGGPGLVAVGSTIDPIDPNGVFFPAIWTSADGLTWTKEATPTDPNPWVSVEGSLQGRIISNVVATPEGFVAVGTEFGLTSKFLQRAVVWTSRDGRSWARVPHDPVFDGGEDSGFRYGMRAVYLIGNRLIATGETPGGPTVWVSPPEPGTLPGQGGTTPEPGATEPDGSAPASFDVGAATFHADACTALLELELAVGNGAGVRGPEAKALFDALDARDPEAILAAVPPVRNHLNRAAEIVANWSRWPPGEETFGWLNPFVPQLLTNVDDIERDARAGIAPDADWVALMNEEIATGFTRIREATQEAFRQAPPEWSAC